MSVSAQLLQNKIIAILRGVPPRQVSPVVHALFEGGIRAVEITLNSEDAYAAIALLVKEMEGKLLVGAGTVLDAAAATAAIEAGAQFIISPSFDAAIVRATKQQGKVSIPGAYTATEIVAAHRAGADLVKVFPANDPDYIKNLRGPLSHIPLMPTGGVTLENIKAFQTAGAVAFGIGSALVDARHVTTAAELEAIRTKAQLFQNAISS